MGTSTCSRRWTRDRRFDDLNNVTYNGATGDLNGTCDTTITGNNPPPTGFGNTLREISGQWAGLNDIPE